MVSPGRLLLGIGGSAGLTAALFVYFATPVSAEPRTTPGGTGQPGIAEVDNPAPEIAPDRPIGPTEITSTPEPEDNEPGEGFGMISGRIGVSTKLIGQLSTYKIIVQEEVNTNIRRATVKKPFLKHRTFHVNWERGTPFFDMGGIPFSDRAYKVTVAAEGMNGSSVYLQVNQQNPRGNEEADLTLTPGTIYTITLRDQRHNPRGNMQVHLLPTGNSYTKRRRHDGRTNNYGVVTFENVEKGDYQLIVGHVNAPFAKPETVRVYSAGAGISNGRPHAQGRRVIVPDGKNVTVEVWSKFNVPLPNVTLTAVQLEVKRLYDFKGTTDKAGRHVFDHMPFGKYQLSVDVPGQGRRDKNFEVKDDLIPKTVTIRL